MHDVYILAMFVYLILLYVFFISNAKSVLIQIPQGIDIDTRQWSGLEIQ